MHKQILNISPSTKDDINGILEIEKEHFANYVRVLDRKMIIKWLEYNPDMFFVLKNECNTVVAFMILVPVSRKLYEKLQNGQVSDIYNFEKRQVEKKFRSDYFFVEEVCISKKIQTASYIKTFRLLINCFFTALLHGRAKYVTTSPLTKEGVRLCGKLGFSFVSENEYLGETYPIYELIITSELYARFAKYNLACEGENIRARDWHEAYCIVEGVDQ